jgi:DNA-binding response OmpR family regulator
VKRVVVVDDDEAIGPAVRDALAAEGVQVTAPVDPKAALSEILQQAPDLVILDVNMPGMSGWELCAILRRQSTTRAVPVLFLSGRTEVKDRIRAMQLGGSDYLTKPFGTEQLRRKVLALVGGEAAPEEP